MIQGLGLRLGQNGLQPSLLRLGHLVCPVSRLGIQQLGQRLALKFRPLAGLGCRQRSFQLGLLQLRREVGQLRGAFLPQSFDLLKCCLRRAIWQLGLHLFDQVFDGPEFGKLFDQLDGCSALGGHALQVSLPGHQQPAQRGCRSAEQPLNSRRHLRLADRQRAATGQLCPGLRAGEGVQHAADLEGQLHLQAADGLAIGDGGIQRAGQRPAAAPSVEQGLQH